MSNVNGTWEPGMATYRVRTANREPVEYYAFTGEDARAAHLLAFPGDTITAIRDVVFGPPLGWVAARRSSK